MSIKGLIEKHREQFAGFMIDSSGVFFAVFLYFLVLQLFVYQRADCKDDVSDESGPWLDQYYGSRKMVSSLEFSGDSSPESNKASGEIYIETYGSEVDEPIKPQDSERR